MGHRWTASEFGALLLMGWLLVMVCFGPSLLELFHTEQVEIEVTRLDKKRIGKRDVWLVFGEEVSTGEKWEFCNRDNWFCGKADSSHLQNCLTEGRAYRVTAKGWRVHVLSWYPNIITATEIEE